MRWKRVAGVQVAFAICSVAVVSTAETEESEKTSFAILYEAPAGCPGTAAFVEQVSMRVGADRIAETADETRMLRVAVRAQGDGFLGTLSVGKSLRRLRAETCVEAAKALALAAAIIIDPEAALASRPAEQPTIAEKPAATDNPVAETPPAAKPAIVAKPESPPAASTRPIAHDRAPSSRGAELWLSAGPSLEARSAVASEIAFALGAFVDAELSRDALVSPALRLAGFIARTTEEVPLGSAEARLIATRLQACPIKFLPARTLDIQPCVAFELGERRIVARTFAETETESRLWAAPAVALRGRYSPIAELGLELEVMSYAPLDRTTITFADQSTNQRQERSAAAVGVSIGAAVATRFSP